MIIMHCDLCGFKWNANQVCFCHFFVCLCAIRCRWMATRVKGTRSMATLCHKNLAYNFIIKYSVNSVMGERKKKKIVTDWLLIMGILIKPNLIRLFSRNISSGCGLCGKCVRFCNWRKYDHTLPFQFTFEHYQEDFFCCFHSVFYWIWQFN